MPNPPRRRLHVPTAEDIARRAAELGEDLRAPGARARVAQLLAVEHEQANTPPPAPPARHTGPVRVSLSKTSTRVGDGTLVVDVYLIPNDPNEENRDDRAADHDPAAVPDAECAAGALPGAAAGRA